MMCMLYMKLPGRTAEARQYHFKYVAAKADQFISAYTEKSEGLS